MEANADMPKQFIKVGILDTSIVSSNTGDFIIMDSAKHIISKVLSRHKLAYFSTHERMCKTSRALQNKIEFNIACCTNLLHAHMGLIKQWNIGLFDTCYLKPVILIGVGWWRQKHR